MHEAVHEIGDRLEEETSEGYGIPGEYTYLLRPRSYLIIGNLNSLVDANGGHDKYMFRSFEILRRELVQPEVVTFDELLARAEWIVESDGVNYVEF